MDRFRAMVPEGPGIEIRAMFGNLGAFVNGNMFMGLYGSDIGLKLAPDDAEALRAVGGAGSFGPAERPMGGYVTMPASMVGTSEGDRWVNRALAYIAAKPQKAPKR
jgi:TfoX/Sxy family transcriptional regulator of competence genes